MNRPRITVTGGCGFIGSHLVERLLRDGAEVCVIDNISTGRRENLKAVEGSPQLSVHEVDIRDRAAIAPLIAGSDTVFHLAALADIVPSIERPRDYFESNVDGTFAVVEAARDAGVRRIMYSASSSCYGIPDVYPTPENAAMRPQYPYALTKYIGEQIVMHWGQVYKINVTSLRLFNAYGPRARTTGTYGAVMGVFLAQKLAGKPFTVVGDGTQTRDFTYVTDIVDAFAVAAQADNLNGEILNVGSGGTYSVNRLIELLGGEATYVPKRPGEPDMTYADTRHMESLLGWRAKVEFEEGVNLLLAHIDDWRSAPVWTPQAVAEATKTWFTYLGQS